MPLEIIEIRNFRNLNHLLIKPKESGLNIIIGKNGAGKTSLLEAIYFTSRAGSFRGNKNVVITREGSEKFTITAQHINKKSNSRRA